MSILIRDVQVEGDVTQVYIEGNRIVEIGRKREADTVIDGKGKIALPGFVNLHTHATMTLFRGWGDEDGPDHARARSPRYLHGLEGLAPPNPRTRGQDGLVDPHPPFRDQAGGGRLPHGNRCPAREVP